MNNTLEFEGKVAFITGGAGGIAGAVSELLLSLGAHVFLTDVDDNALEQALIRHDRSARVHSAVADITDSSDIDRVLNLCHRTLGGLDIVVNAAGIFPEQAVAGMTDDQWRRVHSINLDGTFFVCRSAAGLLRDKGSIVNITSIAGHRGSVRHAHYASSKAGVLGFSRSLAQELAPRIRVNCVSPGPVDTPMIRELWNEGASKILAATPLRRICTPEEVAKSVAFLASDWASFITAETLHINGGHYIYG